VISGRGEVVNSCAASHAAPVSPPSTDRRTTSIADGIHPASWTGAP